MVLIVTILFDTMFCFMGIGIIFALYFIVHFIVGWVIFFIAVFLAILNVHALTKSIVLKLQICSNEEESISKICSNEELIMFCSTPPAISGPQVLRRSERIRAQRC